MLSKSFVIKDNSIEELFCKPFENLPRKEPDAETKALLARLMMASFNMTPRIIIPDDDKPFLFKVIESRIASCFSYTMEPEMILYLCLVAESPGGAIMYLAYFQYWCKKHDIQNFGFSEFISAFPVGTPTQESMSDLWKATKVHACSGGSDNLLDYSKGYASIL